MINTLWWYITVQAVGLAAFPLAYFLFRRLSDRGYTISKPLGILVIGYASWILSVLHIMPSVRLSIILLLLVMGGGSGVYAWRRWQEFRDFVVRERVVILAGEAVFLLFFIGWAVYRAYDPAINHTEQPMDFAFLNASIQTHIGSPEDPWLRGEAISYYYFGYWMMGAISQLAGVGSNISYNLSLALVPAMGAMGIFGLVYNVTKAESARWRYAVAGGIGAAVLLGVAANLESVLEFMRANAMGSQGFWDWMGIGGLDGPAAVQTDSWMPQEFWWWFRTTRVINVFEGAQGIDYTIQEFPFFSFMLGDLHPHVMSIPFVVLFLAFCWNLLKTPAHLSILPAGLPGFLRRRGPEAAAETDPPADAGPSSTPMEESGRATALRRYGTILAMGLALGGLGFTNLWDLPAFATVFLGVVALKAYRTYGASLWPMLRETVPVGTLVIGLAFLLFLPYYLSFSSSVRGIGVVTTTTRPVHMFIVWGLFIVAVAPFVIVEFVRSKVPEDWPRVTFLAQLIALAPYNVWAYMHLQDGGTSSDLPGRFIHVLPFTLLIGAAVYNAMWLARKEGPSGKLFAMVLSALGLLLIMGPELLYVRDSFDSRMNTVFKLYYQGWVVLAAASGIAIFYWLSARASLQGWSRTMSTLWAGVFVVVLVASLYYAPAAAVSKGDPFEGDATLDGLAYVRDGNRAEYDAIDFIKGNLRRGSAILEATGDDYTEFGRISASTGVPTVLNWPGHEIQWRGTSEKFDGRSEDVAEIYETQDLERARILLAKYDVDYVYIGPRERQKHGEDGFGKFDDLGENVFNQGDVSIYRIRR